MSAITNQTKNLGYTAPQPMKNAGTPNPAALRAAKAMETLALVAFGELFQFFIQASTSAPHSSNYIKMEIAPDGVNSQQRYLNASTYLTHINDGKEFQTMSTKQKTVFTCVLQRVDAYAITGDYANYYSSYPNFSSSVNEILKVIQGLEGKTKISETKIIRKICLDLVMQKIKF